jgi:hypothetical protein
MTLLELHDYWKCVSLQHKLVKQFNTGSNYDAANNTDDRYPLVFFELPYIITYNSVWQKRVDTVTFSLNVLEYTKQDSIKDDNEGISYAKEIGDEIISYVQLHTTEFKVQSVNAVSVREYTDDSVAGIRYDITVLIERDACEVGLDDKFNPEVKSCCEE